MAGFKKAAKSNKKCKIAIQGASGSGKTFSALSIATNLCADGKRIAFVDTENSAQLYAPPFDFDVDDFFGDAGKLNYSPDKLIEKLEAARICGGATRAGARVHMEDEASPETKEQLLWH